MRLWHWLRRKLDARKLAEAAAKVAVDEIAKATKTEGQWQ